jgi:hypothetical protein
MPTCIRCGVIFSRVTIIGGVRRYLTQRKRCFSCFPVKYCTGNALGVNTAPTKICAGCKNEKSRSEFYAAGNRCKRCVNALKVRRDVELKKRAIAYKGGCCNRCGYKGHYAPFVFHHTGKKEMSWNQMRNSGWTKVRRELDVCQLLCANCHQIIHAKHQ